MKDSIPATDPAPCSPVPSPPKCREGPSSYDDDDLSIFHPSLHEGLHLQSHHPSPPLTSSPVLHKDPDPWHLKVSPKCLIASGFEFLHSKIPSRPRQGAWHLLVSAKCSIGHGIELLHSKISSRRRGRGCCFREGEVWYLAAFAGLLGALLYMRRRHWREKVLLLFLLQEKDQKISLLLNQIAEMNEIIATRRGVSVPRT